MDGIIDFFSKSLREEKNKLNDDMDTLVHNIRTLNTKISQQLYLISKIESTNLNKRSIESISDAIKKDLTASAKSVLEALKNSSAQKVEFDAFDKLSGGAIAKDHHKIHQIIMSIYYLFINDFGKKNVRAIVDRCDAVGFFDYESVHVALFHVFENSVKYVQHGSDFMVNFEMRTDGLSIIFQMKSLIVHDDEIDKIFEKNFSGRKAVAQGNSGYGLGLYVARIMLSMNGGSIKFINGPAIGGGDFGRNKIIIDLPNF
jgi:K+-sensing histidine kinase KdpD